MNFWLYILLFAAPFTGGFIALNSGYKNEKLLKSLIAFAGGYIFSITILRVIPEVFEVHNAYTPLLILAGFFFQVLIGKFSEGTEHGHLHVHTHNHNMALPIVLYLSLCIHSFTEGLPIGIMPNINSMMCVGIALHELPAAFALMSILQTEHIRKNYIVTLLLAYSLMSPLGALAGDSMKFHFSELLFHEILAFVSGIFLYISTTILFENSENHHFSTRKLLAVLSGVMAAIGISYIF